MDFWRNLFNGYGFVPRTQCGDWSSSLISLHVVSDVIIWLSYLWIPLIMVRAFQAHRSQLKVPLPVVAIGALYVIFITACGWTHFFDALMFYQPAYRINGIVRGITALASLATAVSILRLIPAAVTAPITILAQQNSLAQQHRWLRDILDAATDGVLRLCESRSELPDILAHGKRSDIQVRSSDDLRRARITVQEEALQAGFPQDRVFDLVSALHEAAMNALIHAGGGDITIYTAGDRIQVWVEDGGKGIPLDRLPIATLKQGFSTAGTAGQGWFLVLTFVEKAHLVTGANGTILVLEMAAAHHLSDERLVPFSASVGGDIVPQYA